MAKLRSTGANAAPMRRRAGDMAAAKMPSMALVPLAQAASGRLVSMHLNRPNPSFVTHLIATAQQSPQTRTLRRAATADVEAAYQAVCRSLANQDQVTDGTVGGRMRLTA